MEILNTEKRKRRTNKTITELLYFSERLNKITMQVTLAFITSFFAIQAVIDISAHQLFDLAKKNPKTFRYCLYLSILFTPVVITCMTLKLFIEKFKTVKLKNFKFFFLETFNAVLTYCLFPIEFVLFPLKLLLFGIYIFNSEIRDNYYSINYANLMFGCLAVLDIFISTVIIQVKVGFLRSFNPKDGFLCKIEGIFEEIFFFGMNVILALSLFRASAKHEAKILWGIYGVKIVILLLTNVIYFKELPYLKRTTEKVMAHFLSIYSLFVIIYGACQFQIDLALKIWCFTAPFLAVGVEYYLKTAYCYDFFDKGTKKSNRILKKILTQNTRLNSSDSKQEELFDSGVLKNYLMSGKTVNKKFYSLWKKKAEIYKENILGTGGNTSKEEIYDHDDDQEDNLLGQRLTEEEIEHKKKQIEIEIQSLILKEYTKFNSKNIYCLLVNIMWSLENKLVLGEIINYLNEMILKASTFRTKFFYYYAKMTIQKKLKDYYFHRNLFLNREKVDKRTIFKVEEELKEINELNVDIYYAFSYKAGIKEMTDLIEKFVKLNQKYLSLLRSQSKSLKELYSMSVELFHIHKQIEIKFDHVHSITRNVESTHLTPYFYYLIKCVNLHRRASKIFKTYKQRMINKKNLIDEKSKDLDDISIFYQSVIFMIDSQKKNFGVITDIYGDTRHLKVTPAELIGKHMDSIIMKSQRNAHKISIDTFVLNPISELIGATVYSFVKLPEKNLIIPASFINKITPYEETNFKYCVGMKYLRKDNNIYLLLDGNNEIDAFSYNIKYLFRNPDEYLHDGYTLKDLCPKIYERILSEQQKDNYFKKKSSVLRDEKNDGRRSEATSGKDMTEAVDTYKNSGEGKSKSVFLLDESLDEDEDDMIQARFKFYHNSSKKILVKHFKVKIIDKKFLLGDYNYKVLTLTIDDEAQKKESISKIKSKAKVKEEDQEILDQEMPLSSNRVLESDREVTAHKVRSDLSGGFKFMEGKKNRQNSGSNLQADSTLRYTKEHNIPINKRGNERSVFEEKEPNRLGGSSYLQKPMGRRQLSNNRNLEPVIEHDNLIQNEDEDRNSAHSMREEDATDKLLCLKVNETREKGQISKKETEGNSTINSQYSRIMEDYVNSDDAGDLKYGSSMDDEQFDEDNTFSDFGLKKKLMEGTGSVFSTANLQAHKKFFAFEDAVNKTAGLWETLSIITLYILSLTATVFFVVFIQVTLKDKNLEFEYGNDMYTSFVGYGFKVQNFYSNVLTSVAMNSGLYKTDRYSKFNFSATPLTDSLTSSDTTNYQNLEYSLSSLSSYQTYKMKQTREAILSHIKKIYIHIGNFEKEKKQFFDTKLAYNDHEVNGTAKPASMGIYQGYILLASTKMVEVSTYPLDEIQKSSKNRDLLYIFDNTLNSLPKHYDPFSDFLYSSMNNTYKDFMQFVLLCLFIIIGLVLVLMIVTFFCIYKIKRMFWDIYSCYTNINEGEFESRFRELANVEELIQNFKTSGYFYDFMGEQDLSRTKPGTKKNNKKYQDTMYCFRLLFSLAFIGLFYIIQISFSCGMMLIFQTNVNRALWITNKQQLTQNVLNNQLIFYNSIKQKIILGDETTAYNKPINTFLLEWKDKIKKSSDQIFHLFEENSENSYSKLQDFLAGNSNNSLCSYTQEIIDRKELCHFLDNKIPLRGIVQVYFRTTQYLEEILSHLLNDKENTETLANDPEFVEFEYSFENVYYPAFVQVEDEIHKYFKIYVVEQVNDAVDLIISLMIGFIGISFFFTIFSFKNIITQIERVSFTFQLLSMDTVINNTGVKFRFLKVYRLNQKHF